MSAAAAASSSSSAGAAACTGAEGGFFFLSGGSAPMGPEEGSAGGLGALAAPSLGCRGRYQLLLSGKALADRYRKIYTAALSDRELGSHPGRYRAPIQQRAGGADTAPSSSPRPRAGLPVPLSVPLPQPGLGPDDALLANGSDVSAPCCHPGRVRDNGTCPPQFMWRARSGHRCSREAERWGRRNGAPRRRRRWLGSWMAQKWGLEPG